MWNGEEGVAKSQERGLEDQGRLSCLILSLHRYWPDKEEGKLERRKTTLLLDVL